MLLTLSIESYRHNKKHITTKVINMYVHGLGDAQERAAQEYDWKYGWMDSIKIICPKCKSENCEWEDYDEEHDEWSSEYTFYCFCNECEHEFEHYHTT